MDHHGTYSGWNKHHADGTPICADCRDAASRYMRHYRRRSLWPLELTSACCQGDLDGGLGLAVARTFREGA